MAEEDIKTTEQKEQAKKEEGIRAETIDESRKKAGQELLHAEKTRQQGSVA